MIFRVDDGSDNLVRLSVLVRRGTRDQLDDLCFQLRWSRDRLVEEILSRSFPNIEVVSDSSVDLDK